MGEHLFSSSGVRGPARQGRDFFVAVCAASTPVDLDRTYSFPGRDKQQRTMSFGGNLLALYTHEVHHRGGVSVILDGWGVENDWSEPSCDTCSSKKKGGRIVFLPPLNTD